MSGLEGGFDPVGVVIDWLDACRQRRLTDLLELYADQATLDCCGGGRSSSDELVVHHSDFDDLIPSHSRAPDF
jgi:hypothetical protein